MVRFARAEGSKASNKKIAEDATPWNELKPEPVLSIKKSKNKFKKDASKVDGPSKKQLALKRKKIKSTAVENVVSKENGNKEHVKEEESFVGKKATFEEEVEAYNSTSTDEKKKKKRKKKVEDKKNENIEHVKEEESFVGEKATVEEEVEAYNSTPTDEKKKKKRKRKVEDNENENIKHVKEDESFVGEKATVEEEVEADNSTPTDEKKKKKKRKKKGEEKQVEDKKPEFIIEDGQKIKVWKSGMRRQYFDLPYEDGERMTRFENMWVQKDQVGVLLQKKEELKQEGLSAEIIMRKMMKAKRNAHKFLRRELVLEQKKLLKDSLEKEHGVSDYKENWVSDSKENWVSDSKENWVSDYKENWVSDSKKQKTKGIPRPHSNHVQRPEVELEFEESAEMTEYDGYWVSTDVVPKLNAIKKNTIRKFLNARGVGEDASEELTETENITLQRVLKKEKRNSNRQLKFNMIKRKQLAMGYSYWDEKRPLAKAKRDRPGKYLGLTFSNEDPDMVKYEGVWVKPEGEKRLNALKEKLQAEGVTEDEIYAVMKCERRKEERQLKNEKKQKVCFVCRESGHVIADCPKGQRDNVSHNVCYKCGSTEHTVRDCTGRGESFKHAACFVCNMTGHIARECPQNPRGLYPLGGGCRECNSVEHFAKDCPQLQIESQLSTLKAYRIDLGDVEKMDLEEEKEEEEPQVKRKKKKKDVKSVEF